MHSSSNLPLQTLHLTFLKLSYSHYPDLHRRGPSAGSIAFGGYRQDVGAQAASSQSTSAYIRGAAPHTLDMRGPQAGFDYDDEEDDDDEQYDKSGPAHDGDAFEDIYSHYATPTPSPNSSAQPPSYVPQIHSSHQRQQDVQRNLSKSDQSFITSASRWGNWSTSKAALNDSQSTFKTKHLVGAHSISKRTLPLSSPAAKKFGWMPQTWATRMFLLVTLLEAAADVSIESMLLSRFRRQQGSIMDANGNVSALPVFVMVFGMAHLYQCFLAIDSVVNRNTILVFGLVVFNSAL